MASSKPQPVSVLRGHHAEVQTLAFLSEHILMTGDAEGEVWVWNLQDMRPVSNTRLHSGSGGTLHIESAEWEGQKYLLSQGKDMTISLWELQNTWQLPREPLLQINQLASSFCRASLLAPSLSRNQRQPQEHREHHAIGHSHQSSPELQLPTACSKVAAASATQQPPFLLALPSDDNISVELWCCQCSRQLGEVGGQHSRAQKWGMCTSMKLFWERDFGRACLAAGYEAGWVAVWALGAGPGAQVSNLHDINPTAPASAPAAPASDSTAPEGEAAHAAVARDGGFDHAAQQCGSDVSAAAAGEDAFAAHSGDGAQEVVAGRAEQEKEQARKTGAAEQQGGREGEQPGASSIGNAGQGPGCSCFRVELPAHPLIARQLHEEPVLALDIEGDGSRGVSGGADSHLVFFNLDIAGDAPSIKVRRAATLKTPGINDVAVRGDGRIAATAGWDGRVRVFSCRSPDPLAILKYHRSSVSAVDFCSQTGLLASASRDGTVALWSIYQSKQPTQAT